MARSWIWPTFLITAAAVGFGVVAYKTRKPALSADVAGRYRAELYQGDEGWMVQVFEGGKPSGPMIGPVPTEADAEAQMNAYLGGLDVAAFYTLRVGPEGGWYFEGWSRGEKITEANGPYASKAIASAAGSNWAAKASTGAVLEASKA